MIQSKKWYHVHPYGGVGALYLFTDPLIYDILSENSGGHPWHASQVPAFLCCMANCSQFPLSSKLTVAAEVILSAGRVGVYSPLCTTWPLTLSDWPHCWREYLEYCLPCLPEGQTLRCSWLSRAPLGLRDQDFLLPSHHFLTASSSLSTLPASLTVSPRSMSLINHMHSYLLVQGPFLSKSHLREAPSICQAMWLCCSVRDHNRKIKNKMSISFKMSLDQWRPTV